MSLPTGTYPLPPGWRTTSARRTRRWTLPVAIAAWILLLAATAAALASDAIIAAGAGALVLVVLTVWIAVVDDRSGDERSLPELINAITLTTAEVSPTDSWVYFFRQKAGGVWSGLWLLAGGVTTLGCAVVLGVRSVQLGGGWLLALIGLVPLGLLAAVIALAGANTLLVRSRALVRSPAAGPGARQFRSDVVLARRRDLRHGLELGQDRGGRPGRGRRHAERRCDADASTRDPVCAGKAHGERRHPGRLV